MSDLEKVLDDRDDPVETQINREGGADSVNDFDIKFYNNDNADFDEDNLIMNRGAP